MLTRFLVFRQLLHEAGMTMSTVPQEAGFFECGEGSEHFIYLIDRRLLPSIPEALLAGISLSRSRDGSWGVGSVSAVKGYGPLVYRLAMEWVAENGRGRGLTQNTHGETSPAAQRVWDRFSRSKDTATTGVSVVRTGTRPEFVARTGELRQARVRWVSLKPSQVDAAWAALVDLEIGGSDDARAT